MYCILYVYDKFKLTFSSYKKTKQKLPKIYNRKTILTISLLTERARMQFIDFE